MNAANVDYASEFDRRRAERKAQVEVAKQAQRAKDYRALEDLEVEYGDGMVKEVELNTYVEGLPTMVVVRMPKTIELKAYQDTVKRGKDEAIKATTRLAEQCMLYPPKGDAKYLELVDKVPGVPIFAGLAAITLAGCKAEAEGKG